MREININIEGYNVNGICVGCLNFNRKMYYDDDVKECFKLIGDIDVPDGLNIQVCWECLAAVRGVVRFQHMIWKSYKVLVGYSQKHTFLNSPEDFTKHATNRLDKSTVMITDFTQFSTDVDMENGVKTEVLKEEDSIDAENESLKEDPNFSEQLFYDYQSQEFDNKYFDQDGLTEGPLVEKAEQSSDEDMQLSEIKKKKEKKVRKRKDKKRERECEIANESKGSRKLKNLPPSVVQLYTMTEEEMWAVRQQDRTSKEFERLRYKCTDCLIGFNTEKLMEAHANGKHKPKGKSAQQCDVCKAYFLTNDKVPAHRALHLTAYRCTVCAHTTTLKRSMANHECAVSVNDVEYKCASCDLSFSTKSKLSYHRNVCHQERPQCDCCGKVFANKMTLKHHLKVLPQNKDDKPKEKLFIPCKGCSKIFHSKKSYRAHVVIHDGKTYPCPICGKQFQWKRNLSRHTRAHREREVGAKHECRECGKTFSTRDCYNNHMKLSKRHAHPNTYVHECSYCLKKFPTKWCMVDHIDWEHLKRVKYQCSVCFKPFKTAKIMVAHMNNIHQGKKQNQDEDGEHLCEICGKSYKTVKRLKGHVWAMHTQRSTAKSYKCKLCAATFTWQTSIYKHMKMMHDNKRTKAPRQAPVVKKPEPYPDMDLANRMYFHQNIATMAQGHMQSLPQQSIISGL